MTLPPTTKQFREVIDHALETHGVKILQSRTRAQQGRDYYLDIETYWTNRKNLRKVTYKIDTDTPDEQYQKVIDDLRFWFTLSGQDKFIRIEFGRHYKKITAWCMIS
jgi:hypothetical protein